MESDFEQIQKGSAPPDGGRVRSVPVEEVDYLIIGAGLAGMTLHRLLDTSSKVLLDPRPGRYKLGESILPDHFVDPRFDDIRAAARALPSFSPKMGSMFIGPDSVASFPLPPSCVERAMHVRREELETLMRERWSIPVRREKVEHIDFDANVVRTGERSYRVRRQILDCSGPAMIVARALGLLERLWSSYSSWVYYDIRGVDDRRFHEAMRGKSYQRYDPGVGQTLSPEEEPGWSPSACTIVTRVKPGSWCWQIPLYDRRVLSLGVVSRHAAIPLSDLLEVGERLRAPQYNLALRPLDRSSPHNGYHCYNNFSRFARQTASAGWILVGDAAFFGEPVYATGTTVAVLQATKVADALNEGGWDARKCARYNEQCAELARVATEVHRYNYAAPANEGSGSDESAPEQRSLLGTPFQLTVTRNYARILHQIKRWEPEQDRGRRYNVAVTGDEEAERALARTLRALLGELAEGRVHGFQPRGVHRTDGGLQIAWSHPELPVATMVLLPLSLEPRAFKKAGLLGLSLMHLLGKPYPFERRIDDLFTAVAQRMLASPATWSALLSPSGEGGKKGEEGAPAPGPMRAAS